MAKLKIGAKTVNVDDSFLQLPEDEQQRVVDEIAASLGNGLLPREKAAAPAAAPAGPQTYAPDDPRFTDRSPAAFLRGIPVLGAYVPQAGAAISAAAQPLTGVGSPGATFSERYAKNLPQEQEADKRFDEENPIMSPALQIGGGTASLLPAAATSVGAKLLGLTGKTLPQQVTQGIASGAALNTADALARGEDPTTAAEVGGALGGLVPVAGRAIGAGARAVRRAVTPDAAPIPQVAARVGDVDVPLTQSQMSGDAAQSAEEQILARGGRGEAAQGVAQDFRAQQQAALQQADEAISAGMDPAGRSVRTTPQAAAEAVRGELGTLAGAEEAAAVARAAAAQREGADIALAAGGGRTVADAPFTAGEILSEGLQGRATAARTARTQAYRAARDVDIEIAPVATDRIDQAVTNRLNAGDDRVRLNSRTPNANEAIQTIRETLQQGFEPVDRARGAALTMGPDGRPVPRPVTGTDLDELRKDLIAMQRSANAAARGPNADATDQRAMQRILAAYDDIVEQAVELGTVRGDGEEFLRRIRAARESHRGYRQTFSARGPQDEAGKIVEKIIGRDGGDPASADWIAQKAFGSVGSPGGQTAERVAARIQEIFGADSREWAAYRQGLLAHLTETPAGTGTRTPTEVAERISNFLNGTKGRGLAEAVFSPAERARLATQAERVRATEPAERPRDVVNRVIQRISGADGGLPSTVNEIVGYLYGANGMGQKSISAPLARRLKTELTPESWTAVKQGHYAELTQVPDGVTPMGAQKLSKRLHEFLNGDGKELAEALYTERERNLMGQLADTYKKMIPVEGTTNPSGTAPMLAKIAGKLQSVLLPLLGFSQGGMVGAGMGVVAQKGLERVVTRQAARDATKRFYGPQPTAPEPPLRNPMLPNIIARGGSPALTQ